MDEITTVKNQVKFAGWISMERQAKTTRYRTVCYRSHSTQCCDYRLRDDEYACCET